MCLRLLFCSLLFIALVSDRGFSEEGLGDSAATTTEPLVQAPGDLNCLLVETKTSEKSLPDQTTYEYSLRLDGATDILLGHLEQSDEEHDQAHVVGQRDIGLGFDPSLLELEWLERGRLLHASWKTVPQGSGKYQMGSDLLLLKGGKGWQEIYRDSHEAECNGGMSDRSSCSFTFGYNASRHILLITATNDDSVSLSEKAPFSEVNREATAESPAEYVQSIRWIREWRYRLAEGRLQFLDGKRILAISSDEEPIEGVAEIAAGELGCSAEDALKRIRRLNPSLVAKSTCKDDVLVDDRLPAYEPDPKEYQRIGP